MAHARRPAGRGDDRPRLFQPCVHTAEIAIDIAAAAHQFKIIFAHPQRKAILGDAGICHQDIYSAKFLFDLLEANRHALGIGDIHDHSIKTFGCRSRAMSNNNAIPGSFKSPSNCKSDSTVAACDKDQTRLCAHRSKIPPTLRYDQQRPDSHYKRGT